MRYAFRLMQATCPICSHQQARQLYAVTSCEAASHFVSQAQEPERHAQLKQHIETLWQGASCDVTQCAQCLFCYAWPFRAGDAMFYDLAYERTRYPSWKWEHQLTLDSIRQTILPQIHQPVRVLEIGAGDGAFIQGIIPEVTTPKHVICTEYAAYGADAINQFGVMCYRQDIREIAETNIRDPFHVICMFQTLEHQDQLEQLFSAITRLSAKNAHLYISVPNQHFIEFIETNDALLDMPPNHIGRWNRNCFHLIGKRHGWNCISHRQEIEEPFFSRAKKYAIYRYMRKSQSAMTLAAWALRLRNRRLKRLAQGMLSVWYSVGKLPALYRLRSGIYGSSQWVCLVRNQ